MTDLTPEQKAECDLMIGHLKEAVRLGYSMATPGSNLYGAAVREAFPDLFATDEEESGVETDDDLECDPFPMVSRADEGVWVQTWTWVPRPDDDGDGE